MINLDHVKLRFKEFMKNYDMNNPRVEYKYNHSLEVCDLSMEIANYLNLSREEIKLSGVIGLLHDLGRFEQAKIAASFKDDDSFDHAEYAVNALADKGLMRFFIEEDTYDSIIQKAIYAHNKMHIPEIFNYMEVIFCKILRDADKISILRAVANREQIVLKGDYNETIVNSLLKNETIDFNDIKYESDDLLLKLGLTYDLNYPYSFYVIKKGDYINKFINNLTIEDGRLKSIFEDIRLRINIYIDNKLGGKK
jgi:HD superfamily phosphohydrolase YqeK